MKTLLSVLGFWIVTTGASAQIFVEGRAIPDSARHLFLDIFRRGGQFRAAVDEDGTVQNRENFLTNSGGTRLEFRSRAALFDYLDRSGWEYLDAVPTIVLNQPTRSQFLFRRKTVTGTSLR